MLLDAVAGTSFRVVVNDKLPLTQLDGRDLIERFGARVVRLGQEVGTSRGPTRTDGVLTVVEADGVLAQWFARNGCSAAIVRPDHYVYGVASTVEGLNRQLESIAGMLQPKGSGP